jgi:uncharacterized protein (TIGR02246 family)
MLVLVAALLLQHPALAVLEAQQAAWNRGDLEAFMQGYERSGEVTFVGTRVTRGYEGILENYRNAYGTPDRMGKLTFSELEAKPLGDDHAAVIGRFALERTAAGGGNASGRFTVLLRRGANGWKIIHDHTTSDAPRK